MLTDIQRYGNDAILISQSGIQFMDFATQVVLKKEEPGLFVAAPNGAPGLARLVKGDGVEDYHMPGSTRELITSGWDEVDLDDTLALFERVWLPIPYLRMKDATDRSVESSEGPTNWARVYFHTMAEDEDPDGYTLRATVAFDTKVYDDNDQRKYLAPTQSDIRNGEEFGLFSETHRIDWFLQEKWLQNWLAELFMDHANSRKRMAREDIQEDIAANRHMAHYLNVLHILKAFMAPPSVKMIINETGADKKPPINVDLVLDIGNSRTCGILIEDYAESVKADVMKERYQLQLRDISVPISVYRDPFESRVEFVKAEFGKENFSSASGRNDAFLWPTISRVGPEAVRFAGSRQGTEGKTGISSPKRYLWDEERNNHGWHKFRPDADFINGVEGARCKTEQATVSPYTDFINDRGIALYEEPDTLPVFEPKYCPSSLMTFMISEVIVQALTQINSLSQRMSMQLSDVPRRLRRLVLTVPPSMPLQEQNILKDRVYQAMALVWKSLGWQPDDADMSDAGQALADPPFPSVHMDWDEATCGQVVYLYSEIRNHFNGNADEFFTNLRRPDALKDGPRKVRVASIDIGGGTSDVVIVDYALDGDRGGNVSIIPSHVFKDGFKVAGDDILLEVLQHTIVPDLARGLKAHNVPTPDGLLSRLIGFEVGNVHSARLREQMALQIMQPLGHHVLGLYEKYKPAEGGDLAAFTIGDFFDKISTGHAKPTDSVFEEFNAAVRDEVGPESTFDLRSVEIKVNLNQLHTQFLQGNVAIFKSLQAMCEMVYLHNCDVLLLSGRPSRLPGVQSIVRGLLPLPPDRITPLHNYYAGNWYPFHKLGCIDDPKTTAAVGAMLCVLSRGRIPRFYFRSSAFERYSTVRYLGTMDNSNFIGDDEVIFSDLDLLNPDFELPEKTFEMRGLTSLGFRQLKAARWSASQLYVLDYSGEEARDKYGDETLLVELEWAKRRNGDGEFRVRSARTKGSDKQVGRKDITIKLNTLQGGGGEHSYWLDNGSIVDQRALMILKGVL